MAALRFFGLALLAAGCFSGALAQAAEPNFSFAAFKGNLILEELSGADCKPTVAATGNPKESREVDLVVRYSGAGLSASIVAYIDGPQSPTGEFIGSPKQLSLEYALPDEQNQKGHRAHVVLQDDRVRLVLNERALLPSQAGCNAIVAQLEGRLTANGEAAQQRWQSLRDDFQFQRSVFSVQNKHPAAFTQIVELRSKAQQAKQSNPADAVRFLLDAQLAIAKLFGQTSAMSLVNVGDLADAQEDAGQTKEAIEQFRAALEIARALHTDPHTQIAQRAARYGRALLLDDQNAKALPVLQIAVSAAQKTYPKDSQAMPALLSNLSRVLYETDNRKEALEYARQAQALGQKIFGENTVQNSEFLTLLVEQLRNSKRFTEAGNTALNALQITLAMHGETHPLTSQRLNLVAKVQDEVGRPLEALKFYERALASIKASATPDLDREISAYNNLAYKYHSLDRNVEAVKFFRLGLELALPKQSTFEAHVASLEVGLAYALVELGLTKDAFITATQVTDKARERYKKAPEGTQAALGSARAFVSALRLLGSIHSYRGEFKQGQAVLDQALTLARKSYAPDASELAALLSDASGLARDIAQYDVAQQLLGESIRINTERFGNEHPMMINSRLNLAQLLIKSGSRTGAFEAALTEIQGAYAIALKAFGPDSLDTATIRAEEGVVLLLLGRPADALQQLSLADVVFTKSYGKNHKKTSANVMNIARARADLGEFSAALALFKQSIRESVELHGADHPITGISVNNLGVHYRNLGLFPEALTSLRESLRISELAEGAEHPSTAISQGNVADVLLFTDQFSEARLLFEKSLATIEKSQGPNHPSTASSLSNLSVALFKLDQTAEATNLARRALGIVEKQLGLDSPSAVTYRSNLSLFLRNDTGNEQQRKLSIAESVELSQAGLVSAALTDLSLSKINAYRAAAWAKNEVGQTQSAIFLAKIAVNTIQSLRNQSRTLDAFAQRGVAQNNQGIYQDLADWLISTGRFAEAEKVLAMLKDQELFELVRLEGSGASAVEFTPNEALAFADIKLREAQGKALVSNPSGSNVQTREVERWRSDFLVMLNKLETALGSSNESMRQWRAKSVPLNPVAQGSVLLKYVVSDRRISVLIQTSKGTEAVQVAIDRKELVRQVESMRAALANPRLDPRPLAQSLYRVLIEPIQGLLHNQAAQSLSLDLTDILRYLPFAALHDGKQFLVEKYAVMLATPASNVRVTAASLPSNRAEKLAVIKDNTWQIAALGLTQAQQGFSALPSVKDELESIVKTPNNLNGLLPGTLELDAQFGRAQFVTALQSGKPVVHVASHFQFTPDTEHGTFLLLGDGQKLSLAEIKKMPFKGMQLFALSACNTGTGGGRNEFGAEVEGLGVTIQRAGAQAVLASLWEVSDRSTALLMRQFYTEAGAGRTATSERLHSAANTAISLRNAQLALLLGQAIEGPRSNSINQATADADLALRAITPRRTRAVTAPVFVSDPQKPFAHPFYWAAFIVMGNAGH